MHSNISLNYSLHYFGITDPMCY